MNAEQVHKRIFDTLNKTPEQTCEDFGIDISMVERRAELNQVHGQLISNAMLATGKGLGFFLFGKD